MVVLQYSISMKAAVDGEHTNESVSGLDVKELASFYLVEKRRLARTTEAEEETPGWLRGVFTRK